MGSPLSPIIVDIVMQDLEEIAIQKLSANLLFYFRYVDDIILTTPLDSTNIILEMCNSYTSDLYVRLQFIMEISNKGKLSFLDTMIMIDKYKIIFDRYKKDTCSGRFLNFHTIFCVTKGILSSVSLK